MRMSDWPLPTIRLSCEKCGLTQELDRAETMAIWGDEDLFSFRMDHFDCSITGDCKVIYQDAFLVDAIIEPDPEKVLKKECIAEAMEWRKKLGISPKRRDNYVGEVA